MNSGVVSRVMRIVRKWRGWMFMDERKWGEGGGCLCLFRRLGWRGGFRVKEECFLYGFEGRGWWW